LLERCNHAGFFVGSDTGIYVTVQLKFDLPRTRLLN
jgi:hypothetical protein